MEITDILGLILELSMHNFVEIFLSNEEVFDAKRISYSELGLRREYFIINSCCMFCDVTA